MKTTCAMFLIFSLLACSRHKDPEPDLTCSMVHMTKGMCPAGYKKEDKPRFTEKDGSKEFACVSDDPYKERCIDELKAGESASFTIHMPTPTAPPSQAQPATDKI